MRKIVGRHLPERQIGQDRQVVRFAPNPRSPAAPRPRRRSAASNWPPSACPCPEVLSKAGFIVAIFSRLVSARTLLSLSTPGERHDQIVVEPFVIGPRRVLVATSAPAHPAPRA